MPIIALIEVHQCDSCKAVAAIDRLNRRQELAFESEWADGITYSFCPKCKDSNFAKARIAGEQTTLANTGEKRDVPSH
jgi:hypothetical protein